MIKIKKKPILKMSEIDGNIFFILGAASKALRKIDEDLAMKEMAERVTNAGSYHEALGIIQDYIIFK